MWCRAILAAIALTYIVCVLILNGIQKEDLDVNTLRKLQRHNVNLDDMNNEALRKECEMVTRNSSESADENTPATINEYKEYSTLYSIQKEDQKMKLSDTNLQNIIINYFNNVQKTNRPNNSEKVENEVNKPSTDLPNVENFMNVWKMFSKTKEHEVEEPTTEATVVIPRPTRTHMRIDNKNMEYINKILKNIARSITTTSRPTTKQTDYGLLAQRVQEILANTSKNQPVLSTQTTVAVENFYTDNINEESKILHNKSIKYIDDIITLTYPFKIFGPVSSSNKNIHFENKYVRPHLVDDVGPENISAKAPNEPSQYKNQQIKSISEDIIREISNSVKERVLQDLKKEIVTTMKTTSTTKYATVKPTRQTEEYTTANVKHELNKEKVDAADVLAKLMEMFHQLKANKEVTEPELTKNKFSEDNNIKTENNARITIAYPPTYNFSVIKPIPLNITSVIINPYNPLHPTPIIQTALLPNERYAFLNINTPVNAKGKNKITQLNIFNTKNSYHTSPITLQTNAVEVPPLGIPSQQSVVYQNIVVPTNRPLEKVKHDFRSYTSHDKYKNLPPYQRPKSRDFNNRFGAGRYERNKDLINDEATREFINEEYAKEINKLRNPIKYKEYRRPHHSDHNIERFHEKLERTDDWSRTKENRNIDDNYSATKLIPRHQLPLNDAKKRSRYDDTHFKNFLKTQQKVNDMLERILATKTISNGPRSVETTVD